MSTHYTAGGMPLAFTQEDFLVMFHFKLKVVARNDNFVLLVI